ncbi:pitrilysin family protein [uncultured Alistipes sp.]|mgnify:FL=1|uniref:M16 family metallopeptidase n=1 Tax=uncultured Alistipes sp. TaxID=538949 RepID=UPI0025F3CAED|nr:pitrilysin family protein [uncultured Alistipes sp.]
MKQPAIRIPSSLEMPRTESLTLRNGLKLYTLRVDNFEVVRISFVFHAGSVTQNAPFVAGTTANLLAEGSSRLTGRQIAEQLDFYGSYFEASLDRDYVYISFCSLRRYFRETLKAAEEILLRPVFPEHEVETYCRKRRQQLAVERTKVDTLAREAFAGALFGPEHPYGIAYPESAYDTLERRSLTDHYRRLYTGGNAIAVCSGHVGEEELKAIVELAEQLPEGSAPEFRFPEPESRPFVHIERPEALQSSLRIGRLLFPRNHPDFTGMQVVATVLGGYFGSRLMRNLREQHGYTYGVMASAVNFDRAGYLAIATQVGAEVTRPALDEIFREIDRLRREPVGEEELTLTKRILTGEMMRILDGPFGIADVAIENILSHEGEGAVNRQLQEIRTITPERIQSLARQYLDPERLVTAVVGPTFR